MIFILSLIIIIISYSEQKNQNINQTLN